MESEIGDAGCSGEVWLGDDEFENSILHKWRREKAWGSRKRITWSAVSSAPPVSLTLKATAFIFY